MLAFLRNLISNVGGRRFLLAVLTLLLSTGLVWHKAISDYVYRDIILGTVAVYIAANTTQKVKGDKKDGDQDV